MKDIGARPQCRQPKANLRLVTSKTLGPGPGNNVLDSEGKDYEKKIVGVVLIIIGAICVSI